MKHFLRPRKISVVHLVLLFCVLSVIGFFVTIYYTQSHNGLPIGWDTPRYSAQASALLKNGLATFLAQNDYYNFAYATLLSLLVLLGFSSLTVEIFVPIIMCAVLVITPAIITKKFLVERDIIIYTALMSLSWFAAYRLAADLHPNLLALIVLLYTSMIFLFKIQGKIRGLRRYLFIPLLLIASFIHIETTLFFTFILILTLLTSYILIPEKISAKKSFINGSVLAIAILPATILYFNHMNNLISYGSGNLVSYTPLSIIQWLSFLGISSPLSILGIYIVIRNSYRIRNFNPQFTFNVFICSWVMSSIAFGVSHYFYPNIFIFSERALMLFPVPFVAGIGIKSLIGKLNRKKLPKRLRVIGKRTARVLLVAVFLSFLFFTYLQVLIPSRVWISESAYEKISFLSKNYDFETPPIFILNDYDQYAGDKGNLNNDYIGAIFGEHFAYLGRLDFLMAGRETPFVSLTSQIISAMFIRDLQKENVFGVDKITAHEVIIISDFYLPNPLPDYDKLFFDEIHDGVFILNSTKFALKNSTYIPFYSSSIKNVSDWYPIQRDWAESKYTLELWDENPVNDSLCEVPIAISESGNYKFNVRYETSNNITVSIDSTQMGQIQVNQQTERGIFTAYQDVMEGIHILRFSLDQYVNQSQYASLDYIEYTLMEQ